MSFNDIVWSPNHDEVAVVAHVAADELLSRLDFMTLQPKRILEVGCGTGKVSQALKVRYPNAEVIAIDLSEAMLQFAKKAGDGRVVHLLADASTLPFKNETFDLIVANFLSPWHDAISSLLKEWQRLLRAEGLLMLSALGPDTLKGIAASQLLPTIIDMHEIGDLLLQVGFADPVLDVNYYTVTYRDKEKMLNELKATHMISGESDISQALPVIDGKWQVIYEVVYAHTFNPEKKSAFSSEQDGTVRIPLTHLRHHLKMKS